MLNTYPEPYRSGRVNQYVDPSTCYSRQCTSYCAWKVREATGKWLKRTGDMNARNWIYRLPENGYKKVSGPKSGGKYIGVIGGGSYGHVVWSNGNLNISEYNWNVYGGFGTRKLPANNGYTWYEIVKPPVKKSIATVAKEVIAGKWGDGAVRVERLKKAGYNASTVQKEVNRILGPKQVYYTVKKGDTMSGIASRYKISLNKIKKLNPQIKNINLIHKGQKVRVK